MGLARRADQPVDFDAYLAFLEGRPEEEDWELIDGQLVLMTRPMPDHAQIVANFIVAFRPVLDQRDCRVLSDVLVRNLERDDFALTPDVLVRCGPAARDRFVTDPIAIVEVLSPSTIDYDRGQKLVLYKGFPTIGSIVLVYQTERRIEVFRRRGASEPDNDGDGWVMDVIAGEGQLDLPELDFAMPLSAIYYGAAPELP